MSVSTVALVVRYSSGCGEPQSPLDQFLLLTRSTRGSFVFPAFSSLLITGLPLDHDWSVGQVFQPAASKLCWDGSKKNRGFRRCPRIKHSSFDQFVAHLISSSRQNRPPMTPIARIGRFQSRSQKLLTAP